MNEMQLFNYESKEVRTIKKGDEIWWVAKDVCEVLEIKNVSDCIERLEKDEVDLNEVIDSLGRLQKTNIVNESGLYTLILRSDKPEAKKFKRWITHEVIPSIRKTGGYGNVEQNISKDLALKIAREKRLTEKLALDSKKLDLERAKFLSELLEKQSPLLPPSSTQRAMSEISEMVLGKQVIELPMLECKFYSLGEILAEFNKANGTSFTKQKVGKILKPHNLQVVGSGNGEFFKDKVKGIEKEVSSWKYSEQGKQRVLEIMQNELMK